MNECPTHGPLSCTRCFADCSVPIEANGWQLINDPGYWGASDPLILILGQSKGNGQRRVFALGEKAFDAVAFAGVRERVSAILDKIGISLDKANIDKHFSATETDIGFASLLRCSVSDPKGKTSGSPIIGAMNDPDADRWIDNCMHTWLFNLNPRLKLVVLFGLTPRYTRLVSAHLRRLHNQSYRRIDNVAVEAAGVTWVFVQHPSLISQNHYERWISPLPHAKRDAVRIHAERALQSSSL